MFALSGVNEEAVSKYDCKPDHISVDTPSHSVFMWFFTTHTHELTHTYTLLLLQCVYGRGAQMMLLEPLLNCFEHLEGAICVAMIPFNYHQLRLV